FVQRAMYRAPPRCPMRSCCAVALVMGWVFASCDHVSAQPADKRLLQRTSLQVDAAPIRDVLKTLGEKHKLTIQTENLTDAETRLAQTITIHADNITLE